MEKQNLNHLSHLWDPYFSQKPALPGTGTNMVGVPVAGGGGAVLAAARRPAVPFLPLASGRSGHLLAIRPSAPRRGVLRRAVVTRAQLASDAGASPAPRDAYRALSQGMSGADVVALQESMANLGYLPDSMVDG